MNDYDDYDYGRGEFEGSYVGEGEIGELFQSYLEEKNPDGFVAEIFDHIDWESAAEADGWYENDGHVFNPNG